MSFESIATGTTVFIDANVFVYAFSGDRVFGNACIDLLERVELGDLDGCLSAAVLGEVAHRLMTLEACQRYGWPYPGIAQRLRRHPREVQQLKTFRAALDEIVGIGLRIFDVGVANVIRVADLNIQHGLLSNDALVIAMMEQQGVSHIASNDADFDRVPGIMRYGPV